MGVKLRKWGNGWFYLDICQHGIRRREPLHTQDRKKAETIRREVENSVIGGKWNVKLATEMTLPRGIERFRDEYEVKHHADSTRIYTKLCFERFSDFIVRRYRRQVAIDEITREDIESFQLERSKAVVKRKDEKDETKDVSVSASTVNRDIRELSTLFGWVRNLGGCRLNPCEEVKPLKGVKRVKLPLSPDEIRKLLESLPEILSQVVLLTLETGCRLGEILNLRKEDVDLSSELLVVRSRDEYKVKDREERALKLTGPAIQVLRKVVLRAGTQKLLFTTTEGTLINERNALRDLHAGCKKAGIRRVNFYLLRHSFASYQARYLFPHELKKLLGHSDVRTADKFYVHVDPRGCRLRSVTSQDKMHFQEGQDEQEERRRPEVPGRAAGAHENPYPTSD